MGLTKVKYFELDGNIKCQCCENIFPKEFADRCLGRRGGSEQYSSIELIESLGICWKNYDKKGQWYFWKNNFICTECAQKLIDNGEAKITTYHYEYWKTCEYDKLPENEKQYAKPSKGIDGEIIGSDISIPCNVLVKIRNKKK